MKRTQTLWAGLAVVLLILTPALGRVSPTKEDALISAPSAVGTLTIAPAFTGQIDRAPASPLATEDLSANKEGSIAGGLAPMGTASILEVPSAYSTIQDAISAAGSDDTIQVAAGTYVEAGQILIDKNLTIVGAGAAATTIKPAANTGGSGDARGWFLVQAGVTFNLSGVTLDGDGKNVHQAIRSLGEGAIRFCDIRNISYPSYLGSAVVLFGNVVVEGCSFENIGRIGVIAFGTGCTSSVISGCTYKGKGVGDWLDYAVEVGGGATASILNCRFSDCLGTASSDGSASAGILVTDYFGPGTAATITGCLISNCTIGIDVGYNDADASTVTCNYNNVAGNVWGGVACTGAANSVDAEGNWWGTLDSSFAASMVGGNVDIDPILLTSQIDSARMGARLVALQNNDGGWDWPLDDGNPDNASPRNTIGPTAMGLAKAYRATGDATMLAALQQSSAFLLAKTNNFSPSDGYLAAELDDVLGVATHVAHLNANFYGPLATGTYDRKGEGTLYDAAAYVNQIRTDRSGSQANLAAWDIGMGIVGAQACGADTTAWVAGVKAEIDELDGDADYDVIGLAGALYGLAVVGEEFDPTAGEHAAASNLADLATILAGYQLSTGGFTWNSGYVVDNDDNETIQETAYAVLALNEIGGYAAEITKAIKYMQSVQLGNGGWKSWAGGGENNEITAESGWAVSLGNRLELNVAQPSLYVKSTEAVVLDLDIANLLQRVTGLQAILNFSSAFFMAGTGQVNVVAGGGAWNDLIYTQWTTGGDLDVAVGVQYDQLTTGTEADATTATITLTPTGTEGTTRMVFRPEVSDIEATLLSSILSTAVSPSKVDSLWIVIDDTDPAVAALTATQDQGAGAVDVLNCAATTLQGTVAISVDASDALAGLEAEPVVTVTQGGDALTVTYAGESPAETFNYTVDIEPDTANGTWTIEATATDKAGNDASVSGALCVDKNQITGQVELESLVGGLTRTVTFVATGGVKKTWDIPVVFPAGSAVGTFTLTEVPDGTTALSAKTNWNLRRKVACSLDGDGQASADFIGTAKLRGGDLNGSNSINILDYSVMKISWMATTVGDINGDGGTALPDYAIMKSNWFVVGDAE